jgi:hypothetical protein
MLGGLPTLEARLTQLEGEEDTDANKSLAQDLMEIVKNLKEQASAVVSETTLPSLVINELPANGMMTSTKAKKQPAKVTKPAAKNSRRVKPPSKDCAVDSVEVGISAPPHPPKSPSPEPAPARAPPLSVIRNMASPSPAPSTPITVPTGPHVSEVTVETQDEGSSNESSDGDEPTPASELHHSSKQVKVVARAPVNKKSQPSRLCNVTTFDDDLGSDDFSALLRGPTRPSQGILDGIESDVNAADEDDESSPEELEEEEEEEQPAPARNGIRSKAPPSSETSEEEVSDEEDDQIGGSVARQQIAPMDVDETRFTVTQSRPIETAGNESSEVGAD